RAAARVSALVVAVISARAPTQGATERCAQSDWSEPASTPTMAMAANARRSQRGSGAGSGRCAQAKTNRFTNAMASMANANTASDSTEAVAGAMVQARIENGVTLTVAKSVRA